MTEPQFQRVASLGDLAEGSTLCVEVAGREILLCHSSEGVFAIDNLCSHAEARLCEGRLRGQKVLCPMHGAAFDIRDGRALSPPAVLSVQSFPVRQEGEAILIAVGTNEG